MDIMTTIENIKPGMMVKMGPLFRKVLHVDLKENIITVMIRGRAKLYLPHKGQMIEVRIK
ncbi:hypothetical protein FDI67_gp69 [Escherichia phage phiKP26]|uniref:Uncharacterized protein n=8 Tax=Rogunavirus TaxID=1920866 RepID=A0A0N7IRD5_9CAUD|nr:hypothetical protein e41c_0056 [Escherichia phage e4/1c]YP_009055398.1 hypothetical protein LA65_gp58 [Escherichia phage vB_EcoS_AHS24]YP_009056109.1 hypothetical protein LD31_gp54 [Escherichia phage vB_EcoS_AKS96]YP_009056571.1 hypothetical protein LD32_gp55 [Escherichia phage vB_EcoS_AHP42]YP_009614743.1 hypothetical protein FDI67_gp69 [Escherichia phage phiKP26]YP_009615885.1 hypothetical protein FDI75_gp50 [Escherichia phage C119]YP_009784124.1 hypothetical protein HOQ90_gp39 [Enteroba